MTTGDTREVWLVVFDPLGDDGGVGGLDWFFNQEAANERYEKLVAENDPVPTHRIRLFNAFPIAEWSNDEVTEYLDTEFIGNDPEGAPIRDSHPKREARLPLPNERFDGALVVASVWGNDVQEEDVPDSPIWALVLLLRDHIPFYDVQEIEWRDHEWHTLVGRRHPNIVPAVRDYEERGGDY